MHEVRRHVAVILLILVASFVIYRLTVEVEKIDLTHSMELLGDKLLAMVPEGPEKEKLAEYYVEFLERVKKREVEPVRVERVAAGILNASNTRETLTANQAEAVIRLAIYVPGVDSADVLSRLSELTRAGEPDDWDALVVRVNSVCEVNESMQELSREFKLLHQRQPMMFQVDEGLKIVVDSKIRVKLSRAELKSLAREMERLEKKKILFWKEDFEKELDEQLSQHKRELARVRQEMEKLHFFDESHNMKMLRIVSAVESLDSLGLAPLINVDSILIRVEKSLKEAGITKDDEEAGG